MTLVEKQILVKVSKKIGRYKDMIGYLADILKAKGGELQANERKWLYRGFNKYIISDNDVVK